MRVNRLGNGDDDDEREVRRTFRRQLAGELGRQREQSVVSQSRQPQTAQTRQLGLHQRDQTVCRKHITFITHVLAVLAVLVVLATAHGPRWPRLRLLLQLHSHYVDLREREQVRRSSVSANGSNRSSADINRQSGSS